MFRTRLLAPVSLLLSHRTLCLSEEKSTKESVPHIVVVGAAGVDFLASVARFPSPDEKMRTIQFHTVGGGNGANTATALARLGAYVHLVSKVGDDSASESIRKELEEDGVDVSYMHVQSNENSATTYIIIDAAESTRTCIHTPMREELSTNEGLMIGHEIKKGRTPDWVHLDSRHTEASIALIQELSPLNVPVSIDIEKFRPSVDKLLPMCTVVFTNQNFPALYYESVMGEGPPPSLEETMVLLLESLSARVVVSTLGAQGSVMVTRSNDDLSDLRRLLPSESKSVFEGVDVPIAVNMSELCRGQTYKVLRCSAWPLQRDEVIDTTGAGDAFIGGFLMAFLTDYSQQDCLLFASLVAAEKLRGMGARSSLPSMEEVRSRISGTSSMLAPPAEKE